MFDICDGYGAKSLEFEKIDNGDGGSEIMAKIVGEKIEAYHLICKHFS